MASRTQWPLLSKAIPRQKTARLQEGVLQSVNSPVTLYDAALSLHPALSPSSLSSLVPHDQLSVRARYLRAPVTSCSPESSFRVMYRRVCIIHSAHALTRRTYATDGSGITLGDLARAFQQMNTAPTDKQETTGGGDKHHYTDDGDDAVDNKTKRTASSSSVSRSTALLTSSTTPLARDDSHRYSRSETRKRSRSSTAVNKTSRRREDDDSGTYTASSNGPQSPHHNGATTSSSSGSVGNRQSRLPSPPLLLLQPHSLSDAYAARLAGLDDASYTREFESALGKRYVSRLLLCLYELSTHRLSRYVESGSWHHNTHCSDKGRSGGAGGAGSTLVPASNASNREWSMPSSSSSRPLAVAAGAKEGERMAAAVAAAGKEHRSAPRVHLSHRLLTAVLRTLTMVDVYALEPEVGAWIDAKTTATDITAAAHRHGVGESADESASRPPFTFTLAQRLLRWVTVEVSRMDAHISLQVLHFITQQTLLWSDAVLETLVDTIELHIARTVHHKGEVHEPQVSPLSESLSTTPREDEEKQQERTLFTLEQYSLLFDTLSRVQAHANATYRLQSPSATSTENHSIRAETPNVEAAMIRRQLLHGHHPVANSAVFATLAAALTHELRQSTGQRSEEAAVTTSVATADRFSLLNTSTATVLFLTRALSLLRWWDDALMAALAPQLTRYLLRHPEAYMGIVMLAGRPECAAGDVALLYAMQRSLLGLLRQRRELMERDGRNSAQESDGRRGGRRNLQDMFADADDDSEGFHDRHHPYHDDESDVELDGDQDGESGSFLRNAAEQQGGSTARSAMNSPGFAGAGNVEPPVSSTSFSSVMDMARHPHRRSSAGSLSLIDLHALPDVVDSLTRFYTRTLRTTSAQPVRLCFPYSSHDSSYQQQQQQQQSNRDSSSHAVNITHAELTAQMQKLVTLIQEDVQRSTKSIDEFATALSPALLARITESLLAATSALSADTPDGPLPQPSPLLVELTYVWTTEIVARLRPPPLPPRDGRASQSAADISTYHRVAATTRWRRALRVHAAMIRGGLLERTRHHRQQQQQRVSADAADDMQPGRFFISDALLAVAPRVQTAVRAAKARLEAERKLKLNEIVGELKRLESSRGGERGAGWRGAGRQPQYASRSGTESTGRQTAEYQRLSAIAATLRRPVRSSDVFAQYSKSISRLL